MHHPWPFVVVAMAASAPDCGDDVLPELAQALSSCSTAAFGKPDVWNPFFTLVTELRKPESFVLADFCSNGLPGCADLVALSSNRSFDCSCWLYKATAINVYQDIPLLCPSMHPTRTLQLFTRNDKLVTVQGQALVASPRLTAFNQSFTFDMATHHIESNELCGHYCIEATPASPSTSHTLAITLTLAPCDNVNSNQQWQVQPYLNRVRHLNVLNACLSADPFATNYAIRVEPCESAFPAKQYFTTSAPYDDGCPTAEYDVDYPGFDLESRVLEQPSACCLSCNWHPTCRAYAWADGVCYFKSAFNTSSHAVPKPGVVSGAVTKCSTWSEAYDIVGMDVGSVKSPTKERCCDVCQATPTCRAMSWSNFQGGTCWLKSGYGDYQPAEGVWSAFVID
ncbi:hypothetical protein DYB30_009931 [Aphanomyces astaci]|uniref:Apple domain-containing protein n=1 Tax=Aphanomyces astaci TaxID=112090 RepID=A0A397DAQ9_APHAT|nr:hypothetical protein DYB30_009931 [Aphanomyces astaci]